tara:strand:+ start:275 stop:955 length:681 start_codon:yes stop_codon:yes gene_type:complete
MYKLGESLRLQELKDLGFNPKTILDIGAHTGQFYGWAKNVWPEAFIWMVEANTYHSGTLANIVRNNTDQYTIATLGDAERDVTFYTRSDKPHTEGASYYKESAYWDIPQLVMKIPKKLETLDELFDDNTQFDLIKIDTQGSELDILSGGSQLCKKASYILLEVALVSLNEGAPTKEEIISYMEAYGFSPLLYIGDHYFPSAAAAENAGVDVSTIIQQDIVFKNVNI